MSRTDDLRAAHEAFDANRWSEVCQHLEAVDELKPLVAEDLDRLAVAQYLVGRESDSVETWTRAFQISRDEGHPARAGRAGFWAGFVLLNRGDVSGGNGWIGRVRRVLADVDGEVVESGFVRYLVALRTIFEGDAEGAHERFTDAAETGSRFGDRDLETLARLGQGRALIRLGRLEGGVACLDEAMVMVRSGEVSPVVVGDSYCTAIEGCQELFDLQRAQRWTEGLSRWCDEHPDLVAFRGQCLLHRAEVLQLQGSWRDALSEVDRALAHHARPAGQLAVGAVHYQQGELHRLRGEFDQAEAAYGQARRRGRLPQPGLALLRLAEGKVAEADAAIRHALAETDDATRRSWLLAAAVEVFVTSGDLDGAVEACQELEATAAEYRSRMLSAVTRQARGRLELASRVPEEALVSLRQALEGWHDLDVPYQAARVHAWMGQAFRDLGDEEGARAEWAVAGEVFADLGAHPDIERLDDLTADHAAGDTHGLSERQLEVLRHVAAGRSNREIADELVISHRTVERHVSDIFIALGVSSRSAATAYAYENDLV